jgi:mRNA interferase MazF
VQRGEIWWASLGLAEGSHPGYRRPVLILQADEFNKSRIGTIVVVALTSNPRLANAPGNVPLASRVTGLPRNSVVNVAQILTLDRSILTRRIRALPHREMARIDAGLRLALAL